MRDSDETPATQRNHALPDRSYDLGRDTDLPLPRPRCRAAGLAPFEILIDVEGRLTTIIASVFVG
jgi:hypothetical protein